MTSQSPTIDLESSKVAVNWDQQKLDELPYSRSLTGLVSLIPGLYATSLDVGGSQLRHRLRSRGAHVRPRRRRRRQLRRHDLGPDLRRLRHLRRSADHDGREGRRCDEPGRDDEPGRQVGQQQVQGPRLGELSVGRFPEQQRRRRAAGQGLRARRQQVHQATRTTTAKSADRS